MDIGVSPKIKMSRLLNQTFFWTCILVYIMDFFIPPLLISKMGYRFGKEGKKAMYIYKLIKNN